ncbi:hypothetical protein BELL_0802g00010 [Botrytis elliptica]|uniref:Uncharacterized protein n=1 Tax=Botrytis elliptica TaxID=278938 RepID=A0A4Z1J6M5_9HELO|nr:hypothetical protein BELL_0802g00010 [Botrytis elliptica]
MAAHQSYLEVISLRVTKMTSRKDYEQVQSSQGRVDPASSRGRNIDTGAAPLIEGLNEAMSVSNSFSGTKSTKSIIIKEIKETDKKGKQHSKANPE